MFVFGGGLPGPVRRLVVRHQKERFLAIALPEPIDAEIANEVGAVAFVLFLSGCGEKGWIVVDPLTGENIPIVESRGIGFQMPFADHRGLIAGLLHLFGNVVAIGIDGVVERINPVLVAVLASKNRSAARRADRIRAEAVGETNALTSNAIDVRRMVDLASVCRDGMGGVIVRHHIEDVRRRFTCGGAYSGPSEEPKQFAACVVWHSGS